MMSLKIAHLQGSGGAEAARYDQTL